MTMEQPRIERVIRIVQLMSGIRTYTISELADAMDMSERTIYRYIDSLKNAGMEVTSERGCPRLVQTNQQYKGFMKVAMSTQEGKALANLSKMESAIESKKCVILKGYASAHSGTIRDREVEPFELSTDRKQVWCFDLESKENKVFMPSRCEAVGTTEKPWTYKDRHKSEPFDIFGFHGTDACNVCLRLDILARNLLLEEHPLSASQLSPDGDNHWLLKTIVYDLDGVARFYLGLTKHIEIINSPIFAKYVQK